MNNVERIAEQRFQVIVAQPGEASAFAALARLARELRKLGGVNPFRVSIVLQRTQSRRSVKSKMPATSTGNPTYVLAGLVDRHTVWEFKSFCANQLRMKESGKDRTRRA